jgi:ATP-binding cassette subfamily B protein
VTERRILRGLARQRRGRTLLVASHRLSVLQDADRILVLDGGTVREQGDHRQLMAQNGLYAQAFRRQSEAAALESLPEDEA